MKNIKGISKVMLTKDKISLSVITENNNIITIALEIPTLSEDMQGFINNFSQQVLNYIIREEI